MFDDLNSDRHENCIFPMTQLGRSILEVIDNGATVSRDDDCDSTELSRFGKETKSGYESYIFNQNLSGTSYSTTVIIDDNQYCKCN